MCEVFGPGVYLLLSENNETLGVCEVVVFGPGEYLLLSENNEPLGVCEVVSVIQVMCVLRGLVLKQAGSKKATSSKVNGTVLYLKHK